MQAFHGDTSIKARYLRRVRAHAKADELIQGTGWESGKGCAVGCTLDAYDHSRYPTELGIPEHLARLEDVIFEGLPAPQAQSWPAKFLSAPRVGADLSRVWPQFAAWMLADPDHGVIRYAQTDAQRTVIEDVAALYREGVPEGDRRWARAARAARAAADAAFWPNCAAKLLSLMRAARCVTR